MNRILALALMTFFLPGVTQGQQKVKEKKEEVVISRKGGSDEKMTIVIDGDKITINGKPVTEYDGNNIVIRKKALDESLAPLRGMSPRVRVVSPDMDFSFDNELRVEIDREMRQAQEEMRSAQREIRRAQSEIMRDRKPLAILGVTTEKAAKGLRLTDVSDGSAADKAGLKEGDVITRFAGTAVADPGAFRELVRSKKPGEEVELSYIKAGEKKERKLKLTLGSYTPEANIFITRPGQSAAPWAPRPPRPPRPPRAPRLYGEGAPVPPMAPMPPMEFGDWNWSFGGRPQLGLRIQDMDDTTGVSVIDVEEGSVAAEAGLQEKDVIVNIDGQRVRSVDEALDAVRQAREKSSYPMVVNRAGSTMTLTVKVPKNKRKADL